MIFNFIRKIFLLFLLNLIVKVMYCYINIKTYKFILNNRNFIISSNKNIDSNINEKNRKITELGNKLVVPKNLAQRNILGQNIINCRSFSLDSTKQFDFIGSFKSLNSIPIFAFPEIGFIGRSNVGKSSLLNCLTGLNKKIAVEGKTPGRTQSINIFSCKDKVGDICFLVDLPGYGYAKISKTQQEEISNFIRDYLLARGGLKLVLLLIDARREVLQSDLDMLEYLKDNDIPVHVVATKTDKLNRNELEQSLRIIQSKYGPNVIPFSAITGQGKKDIWRVIRDNMLTEEEEADDDNVADEIDDIISNITNDVNHM